MSTQFVGVCPRCVAREVHYHPAEGRSILINRHYGGAERGVVITMHTDLDDDTVVMPDVFGTVGPGELVTVRELKLEQGSGKRPSFDPPPDGRPGGWDYPAWKDPISGRDASR